MNEMNAARSAAVAIPMNVMWWKLCVARKVKKGEREKKNVVQIE